jgi:hypothetical protein
MTYRFKYSKFGIRWRRVDRFILRSSIREEAGLGTHWVKRLDGPQKLFEFCGEEENLCLIPEPTPNDSIFQSVTALFQLVTET